MFYSKLSAHNPSSPAVITTEKTFSYSDLIEEIKSYCQKLEGFKISRGDHVAVICNNEFDLIPLLFSIWNLEAVPVLLNTKLSNEEIRKEISFADCKFTFIHQKLLNELNLPGIKTIEFPFREKIEAEGNLILIQNGSDDTAVIIFTSGSSGKPKAVMLSFENLAQSTIIGDKVLNMSSNDRWLASLPFYHIGGFLIVIRSLMLGSSIIIPDSLSAYDLIKSINLFNPTLASLVSNQLKKLIDSGYTPSNQLRMVLLGGGFFNRDLILEAAAEGWKIAKVYGSTETSSFITFMNAEDSKIKPEASGKAISPNKILLTDEGEIIVQSPAVMKGYYNNEEDNALKIKNGFYYTGDIGYLDSEGYLYVEAKRSDLVVSGGENINPAEVEQEILNHPKIKEVSVVGIEDVQWGQIVSAAVVLKKNKPLAENELKNFLKGKIASFKIPKQMIFVDHLPKTELGKVQREKVKDLFRDNE